MRCLRLSCNWRLGGLWLGRLWLGGCLRFGGRRFGRRWRRFGGSTGRASGTRRGGLLCRRGRLRSFSPSSCGFQRDDDLAGFYCLAASDVDFGDLPRAVGGDGHDGLLGFDFDDVLLALDDVAFLDED